MIASLIVTTGFLLAVPLQRPEQPSNAEVSSSQLRVAEEGMTAKEFIDMCGDKALSQLTSSLAEVLMRQSCVSYAAGMIDILRIFSEDFIGVRTGICLKKYDIKATSSLVIAVIESQVKRFPYLGAVPAAELLVVSAFAKDFPCK